MVASRWVALFTLSAGLLVAGPALASPVLYSTSGAIDYAPGSYAITGVTDAVPQDTLEIGTFGFPAHNGLLGDTWFHLQFTFNDGLPPIDVGGVIPTIGYNPDQPLRLASVTSTATPQQLAQYPTIFRTMLEHPDWIHSMSYETTAPVINLTMSVSPVPEPSSLAVFAVALGGLGWQAHRRKRALRSA
jgi:hypothetical protein